MEKRLFGTNGIRGVFNKELTPEMTLKVASSIGTFYSGGLLLLARDGRLSSPLLSQVAAAGLIDAGCTVYDIGLSTTPMAQYATKALQLDAGIMITASHNPPPYNGIKVIGNTGVEINQSDEKKIEKIYFDKSWSSGAWQTLGVKVDRPNFVEEYAHAVMPQIDCDAVNSAGLKVVVDPGNGAGAITTPYILRKVGCKVYTLNANVDGTFPGRPSEPTLDTLQGLCGVVRVFGADLGIAHDGDGDRTIFVDERGEAHWGDRSFALILKMFLQKYPNECIVTPISSGKVVEDIAVQYNGKIVWTEVGSTVVSWKMMELGAKLGGEENGGIFYGPHLPVRDGTMAALLITEILAKTKSKLSQLLNELPKYFTVKSKVSCPDELKPNVMSGILSSIQSSRLETLDGVKAWFEDGSWILIRPSGTEPILRIFAEASTMKRAQSLVQEYEEKVLETIKAVGVK